MTSFDKPFSDIQAIINNLKFTSAMLNILAEPLSDPIDYEHLSSMYDLTLMGLKKEQKRVADSITLLTNFCVNP